MLVSPDKLYHPLYINPAPVMAKVLNVLCEHPYGLTMRELIEHVYGDDPDGGPDNAANSLNVGICKFNAKAQLKKLGIRIWTRKGSNGAIGHGRRWYIFIVREKT